VRSSCWSNEYKTSKDHYAGEIRNSVPKPIPSFKVPVAAIKHNSLWRVPLAFSQFIEMSHRCALFRNANLVASLWCHYRLLWERLKVCPFPGSKRWTPSGKLCRADTTINSSLKLLELSSTYSVVKTDDAYFLLACKANPKLLKTHYDFAISETKICYEWTICWTLVTIRRTMLPVTCNTQSIFSCLTFLTYHIKWLYHRESAVRLSFIRMDRTEGVGF
jgi:hypothetical protein